MGLSMAMMLVNIGVMCSAGRNGKHIRQGINFANRSADNLGDSVTGSDASASNNIWLLYIN